MSEISNHLIFIDGFNVLITIISFLKGLTCFISLDGFLRDASENHGSIYKNKLLKRSIDLLTEYFTGVKIQNSFLYLDSPVSNSGRIRQMISDSFDKMNINIKILTEKSADHAIIKNCNDIAASSDSLIIDKTKKSFDLAKAVLELKFSPDFFHLGSLIKKGDL